MAKKPIAIFINPEYHYPVVEALERAVGFEGMESIDGYLIRANYRPPGKLKVKIGKLFCFKKPPWEDEEYYEHFSQLDTPMDKVVKAMRDEFQEGTEFVLLFEWERTYECRQDRIGVPLAAA